MNASFDNILASDDAMTNAELLKEITLLREQNKQLKLQVQELVKSQPVVVAPHLQPTATAPAAENVKKPSTLKKIGLRGRSTTMQQLERPKVTIELLCVDD
jgi:hypothetical protein